VLVLFLSWVFLLAPPSTAPRAGTCIDSLHATAKKRMINNDNLDQIREYTNKFEEVFDTVGRRLKPILPSLARFLLVVTFLEDSIRILSQWSDQIYYLQKHRSFPWGLSHLFLLFNVSMMIGCSYLAIAKKHTEVAVGGLFTVIFAQSLGYGLLFDSSFFLRNLSVVGGLFMLLADAWLTDKKKKNFFPGLPNMSDTDKSTYLQLAGRILLVFLFMGFISRGDWTLARIIVSVVGLIGCVMVVVGFKTGWATWGLVAFLSVANVMLNNFWNLHSNHPQVSSTSRLMQSGTF
jgi:uncharacterized membrane protein YphA (DoxX/SURF4 family)